jgi:hypothetical protein
MNLKEQCKPSGQGYYTLEEGVDVPRHLVPRHAGRFRISKCRGYENTVWVTV